MQNRSAPACPAAPQAGWLRRRLKALAVATWLPLLLLLSCGFARADPPPAPTVVEVAVGEDRLALDEAALLLEDPSGQLGLASVQALPAGRWQRPKALPVSIGYSRSVWWLRLRLHNDSAQLLDRRFEIASPLQDFIDVWTVRSPSGAVTHVALLGDRVAFGQRPVSSLNPTVPVLLAPRETVDVYLRLSTHDGLYEELPLTLWRPAAFREGGQWHWFGSGLYSGLLLASTRFRGFAQYSVYLCAQLLWHAVFSGDAFYVLWPNHPNLNNQALLLACGAIFASGAFFLSTYLNLKKHLPRCNRLLLACGIASGVASLGALFDSYALTFFLTAVFGMLCVVGIQACALWLSIRHRHRQSVWVLVAWAPVSATIVAYTLQVYGVRLGGHLPALHGLLQIAVLSQLLLMGIGVAYAVGRWREEKIAAERAAGQAHESLALRLEGEVRQRTQALEIANTKLREMSLTDALTGLSNRRHFNELLEAELARQYRQGDTPALCLLDVDHFKRYNDLYGHPQGDAALVAIADVLRTKLRRAGDRAFRVGGEEFALLLVPEEGTAQRRYVDGIREAIEGLGLPHEGNPAGVVTASFGLVQMRWGDEGAAVPTAAAIYREADRLLYLAKTSGRNCVVSDARPVQAWGLDADADPAFSQGPGWASSSH